MRTEQEGRKKGRSRMGGKEKGRKDKQRMFSIAST